MVEVTEEGESEAEATTCLFSFVASPRLAQLN